MAAPTILDMPVGTVTSPANNICGIKINGTRLVATSDVFTTADMKRPNAMPTIPVKTRARSCGRPSPNRLSPPMRNSSRRLTAVSKRKFRQAVGMQGSRVGLAIITACIDAAQAKAATRKLLELGVDGIKLFASSPRSPSLPESAIRAAVDEAHQAGKPVFVHPNSGADVLTAVRAGVDVVAHTTPYSGPWNEAILAAMKDRRVALIPTLKIWMEFMRHDRIATQEQVAKTETDQLRAWVEAGGTVLFGTDVSYINYDPSGEYALMAEAGMRLRQILTSLTTAPAERFGGSTFLGRIAVGWQADVVVLKGDPSKNIRALAEVEYTIRAGKIIYRASD